MKDFNLKVMLIGVIAWFLCLLFTALALISFVISAGRSEGREFIVGKAENVVESITEDYDSLKSAIDGLINK